MKKRRIKTWPIIMVMIVVCFIILLFCLVDIYRSLKSGSAKEVKILDTIENYGYTLDENDSAYVKSLFKELRVELNKEKIDEETYASLVSQIFVADFYSLKQAINKNDVGGTQFVYESYQNDFVASAKSKVYAYIENNIYGTREQALPMVSNVEVTDVKKAEYDSDIVSDEEAYTVDLYVTYEEDMGYPTHVTLILVHENEKLEIVKMY